MCSPTVFCPNCDAENSLSEFSYSRTIEHRGKKVLVENLKANVCEVCAEEPVLQDQIRENRARYCDAKRGAEGLLSGAEVSSVRQSLGLTQADASRLFGGGAHAFSKYERGEVSQSSSMDKLVRLASEFSLVELWLRERAGMSIFGVETAEYDAGNGKVIRLEPSGIRRASKFKSDATAEYSAVG